jgi:hypothetical protein
MSLIFPLPDFDDQRCCADHTTASGLRKSYKNPKAPPKIAEMPRQKCAWRAYHDLVKARRTYEYLAAGRSVCLADVSQKPAVDAGDCHVAGFGDWRQHRYF